MKTDPDFRSFKNGDKILYSVFDYAGRRNGLATSVYGAKTGAPKVDFPRRIFLHTGPQGQECRRLQLGPGNFSNISPTYVSRDIEKGEAVKVTDTNPQMAEYNWGTAKHFQMVHI